MAWKTTNDPRSEVVTLRMTVSEAATLENAAARRGLSRSAYVREAVERVLRADKNKAARLRGKD